MTDTIDHDHDHDRGPDTINIAYWYDPMPFFFTAGHYRAAWTTVGLIIHIGAGAPSQAGRRSRPAKCAGGMHGLGLTNGCSCTALDRRCAPGWASRKGSATERPRSSAMAAEARWSLLLPP